MAMMSRDELELIYMHLFSMNRFNHLIELMGAESSEDKPKEEVH